MYSIVTFNHLCHCLQPGTQRSISILECRLVMELPSPLSPLPPVIGFECTVRPQSSSHVFSTAFSILQYLATLKQPLTNNYHQIVLCCKKSDSCYPPPPPTPPTLTPRLLSMVHFSLSSALYCPSQHCSIPHNTALQNTTVLFSTEHDTALQSNC